MKTNMYQILKIVVGLALTGVINNCSPTESTRMRAFEDGAVDIETSQQVRQQSAEALRLEALLNEAQPAVSAEFGNFGRVVDEQRLMDKVINPLRDIVLNRDYLMVDGNRNARTASGQYIMPSLVSLFNEALILVYKANPDRITSTDTLARYKALLFWDCDRNLEGSCEFIRFFRDNDSVNMTEIVKMIHDQETDDAEKLRLIRAAFDLKNRRLDAALRFMLLERIAGSMAAENAGDLSPMRRRQDADLFANILKVSINDFSGEQRYVELIRSLNPWLLSRNVDRASNPAMTDIIALASENLLYNEQGQLASDIAEEVIPGLLYGIGSDYEQGVQFIKANIRGEWKQAYEQYSSALASGASPSSLTSLQESVFPQIDQGLNIELYGPESEGILATLLKDVSFEGDDLDEYFYLANRAFYGHFNIDDATAFWGHTGKDVNRLMEEVEKLIKIQIVNNIVLTNVRMNDFYNRNENTKLIDLLRESDKEASKIRKAWTKTIVRSQSVKSFITRVVNPNTLSSDDLAIYNRINSSVDAMTKNIKFLVTYPNMFPLMHVMASLEMRDTIRSFFGTFSIDSLTVISYFFSGHFAPWFNFGNDGERLDSTEIIYTYYYALVTQIFETYATNTLVNFSHEDFFEVVVKKMILQDEKDLDGSRRNLFQRIEEFKNNANAMRAMCLEEKRLQEQEAADLAMYKEELGDQYDWYEVMKHRQVMRPRNRVTNNMAFIDIGFSLYDGTNPRADKIGNYIGQIYGSSTKETFKSMRIEFPQKLVLAGTILDVFKQAKGGDQEEIEQIFNAQFEEYYRLRAEYVDMFFDAEKDIRRNDCDWLFLKRDRDLRQMVILREAEELGRLFERVWDVLSPLSDEQRASLAADSPEMQQIEEIRREFAQSTQDEQYPEDYRNRFGYNRISTSRLTSYKMDTATRVYSYLQELFPGQYTVTMPADFATAGIYAESSPDLVYFDWSIEDKEEAKAAFVRSGVIAFANQMSWANVAPPIGDVVDKGEILVDLFKLGEMSRNPEVNCESAELDETVRAENCVKVTAAELIDHYKKIIDYINIDERDMKILELTGKENKYTQTIYENFIKKKDEHVLYSYYDLIFRRVFSDNSVSTAEETWFTTTLVKYVDSVHKISGSTFIFPAPEEINDIYVNRYSSWLSQYYQKNFEFLEEVKMQIPDVAPFQFRYRTDRVHRVGAGQNEWSQNRDVALEPLVSDLIFSKFQGLNQQLNNDTSGYFSSILNSESEQIAELVSAEEQ